MQNMTYNILRLCLDWWRVMEWSGIEPHILLFSFFKKRMEWNGVWWNTHLTNFPFHPIWSISNGMEHSNNKITILSLFFSISLQPLILLVFFSLQPLFFLHCFPHLFQVFTVHSTSLLLVNVKRWEGQYLLSCIR